MFKQIHLLSLVSHWSKVVLVVGAVLGLVLGAVFFVCVGIGCGRGSGEQLVVSVVVASQLRGIIVGVSVHHVGGYEVIPACAFVVCVRRSGNTMVISVHVGIGGGIDSVSGVVSMISDSIVGAIGTVFAVSR